MLFKDFLRTIICLIILSCTVVFIPKVQGLPISNDNGSGLISVSDILLDGNINTSNTTENTTAITNTTNTTTTTIVSVKEVSRTLFCSNTQYLTITTNATILNSPYKSGSIDICDYNIIAKPNFTTVIMIFYKNIGERYSIYPSSCSGVFDFTYGGDYITFVNPEDRERIKYCTFDELPVYVITNDTLLMRYHNNNDGMFQDNGIKINVSYLPYGYIIQKRHPRCEFVHN